MHRPGKDTPEDNPKERGRTEFSPHDSTEDRSQTRNIQELNHEYLPRRHRDVVHAILKCVSRRRTLRVNTENTLDKLAVNEVTNDKSQEATCKCNHNRQILYEKVKNKKEEYKRYVKDKSYSPEE